jgi:hypothetical protein
MAFLGVYRAIYDYVPQSEGELTLTEGDLLFVLDNNSDDDWWKAKKKAMSDEEDEPEGLIPNNYIEEVCHYAWSIPLALTDLSSGASIIFSKSFVRLHQADRRRALVSRRRPPGCLRHVR